MTSFTYNSSSVTHVNAIPLLNEADLKSFAYYSPGSLFMLTPWADRPMPMYLHTRERDSSCWEKRATVSVETYESIRLILPNTQIKRLTVILHSGRGRGNSVHTLTVNPPVC